MGKFDEVSIRISQHRKVSYASPLVGWGDIQDSQAPGPFSYLIYFISRVALKAKMVHGASYLALTNNEKKCGVFPRRRLWTKPYGSATFKPAVSQNTKTAK